MLRVVSGHRRYSSPHHVSVHFDQDTEDSGWLNAVAAQDWIVLAKDERIRYRPPELRTLDSACLRTFIMPCGNVRVVDTAAILLKAMPRILRGRAGEL